jgi:alginate O-acetyltransferase complex protein AlgJ
MMANRIKKNRRNWFLSVWFILLITLPFFGSIYGWDFYEAQNENRVMASFPETDNTPLSLLPEKLEAYYNDHFGFRNTFIRRHRKLEEQWFGRTPGKAIRGSKDGWWFYGVGDSLDDYLGYRQFSAAELLQWEQALKARKRCLAEKNIPYLFLLMPDKVMVYPECAPSEITNNRSTTRFEQLQKHMQVSDNFSFLYPIHELREGKKEGDVYYPEDTHWNDHGGYIGYCYLVEQLKPFYPSIVPVQKEDCTIQSSQRAADIAGMLTGKEVMIAMNRLIPPQHDTIIVEADATLEGENWKANVRSAPVHAYNPAGSGTALVIHDSFVAQGMSNLLPTHFEHTYFFYMYANTFEFVDMVNRINPDIVIEMRVERSLRRISEGMERPLD